MDLVALTGTTRILQVNTLHPEVLMPLVQCSVRDKPLSSSLFLLDLKSETLCLSELGNLLYLIAEFEIAGLLECLIQLYNRQFGQVRAGTYYSYHPK